MDKGNGKGIWIADKCTLIIISIWAEAANWGQYGHGLLQ